MMLERPRLYVIIPVLNEAGNMPRLLGDLRRLAEQLQDDFAMTVLLVDDGSRDGTADIARQEAGGLPLEVLVHPVNQGPGRAFATAFAALADRLAPTDWVVTMEGDNTSRAEMLLQMITRSREGFDVVLASPYLYGGGISHTSSLRVILSHIANGFVKEALGLHGIATMSSFFRLYRGEILLRLQALCGPVIIERSGFESMIELLLKFVYLKTTISEVAMQLDTSRRIGKSKMKIVRTAFGYLTLWKDKGRWLEQVSAVTMAPATHRPAHES